MNRNVDMRVEAAGLAGEARQLKREERRALKTARRIKSKGNSETNTSVSLAYLNHRELYLERMNTRRESRLIHLARMLLKGKDYSQVEAFTYERVSVQDLADRIWQWEPSVPEEFVAEWLGQ